jgi:hypothetical protein
MRRYRTAEDRPYSPRLSHASGAPPDVDGLPVDLDLEVDDFPEPVAGDDHDLVVAPSADLIERLTADIVDAARTLGRGDMRYYVDTYEQIQKMRIRLSNAARASAVAGEPHKLSSWLAKQFIQLEAGLVRLMKSWAEEYEAGLWALSQYGVGPVIAAGLLAHIDPERAVTAGNVWSFAGLNPQMVWLPGQTRPYNARLKVICWKAGDSFVKFHRRPECYYGHIYAKRKSLEIWRNENGQYREIAERTLAERRIQDRKTLSWYEAGMLPPGRIELRSRRYAVKLFLAHFQQVLRESNGLPVVAPFAIAQLGHSDYIAPPGWPLNTEKRRRRRGT